MKFAGNRREKGVGEVDSKVLTRGDRGEADEASPFELRLLGGFELRDPTGQAVELPTRKCELLLAYLAMPAGQAHGRDKLAALLWADRDEEQARGSLRKALSAIRSALGAEALRGDRDTVALEAGRISVDAEQLAVLAAEAGRAAPADGVDLRYGEFLDSRPSTSADFADWLAFERTRCRNLAQTVLDAAARGLADAGQHREAIAVAQRLLSLDGLREESHRLLMRLHAQSGERSQAQAQFQACRDMLKRELGVQPSPETARVAHEIARDDASGKEAPQRGASAEPALKSGPNWPTDRPKGLSVAVLPFTDKGGDQDFFAAGLCEDIITELSRQKDFVVIARQSSFAFAADPGSVPAAAGELDVRYVLTGSLRRSADQLRITVQLFDAAGDRCVWAERYDRPIGEIFSLQDEMVSRIIATIDAQMRSAERERAARKRPENLDAWELFHRGMWHLYRFTPGDMAIAEGHFREAKKLSPDFALAPAGLAYADFCKVTLHFVKDVEASLAEGAGFAEEAVRLDAAEPFAHFVLGRILVYAGQTERAIRHLQTAIELNPSFAQAYFGLAQAYFWSGSPADALHHVDQAVRLNPKDPLGSMFMTLRSFCHYWLDDLMSAERAARDAVALNGRETWARLALAVALMETGRVDEARAAIAEARLSSPGLTLASFDMVVGRVPSAMKDRVHARLKAAGLD